MSKPKNVYLVAQYYAKPKDPSKTRFPGYMSDENNIAWDERVDVVLGLKNRDITNSKVILNISHQTVEKDGFRTNKSFDELFAYFYTANPSAITKAVKQFGLNIKLVEPEPELETQEETK